MSDKTQIYLIGSDEKPFNYDIFCAKKLKSLYKLEINLDAVFSKTFKELPIVEEYCLNHHIERVSLSLDEQNYFLEIVRCSINNPDKRNLAALVSEKKALDLNFWFRQDKCFEPHIV